MVLALALLEGVRTGVAGDLLVHLVSGMNYMMGWNEPPKKVMALGAIIRFPDGRNMPDVQAALYEYAAAAGAPVYLRLNLGCEGPETYRFQGSKGVLEVTEFGLAHYPQTGEIRPSYYTSGYPQALREAYLKQWHKEHDPEIGKEPIFENYVSAATTSTMFVRTSGPTSRRSNRASRSRRCRLRPQRRSRVSHGERVLLPRQRRRHLGRRSSTIKS